MRQIIPVLAIFCTALVASECSAQPPQRPGAQRPGGRRPGGPGGERDPAQMVARLIKEFDKDGDEKLDAKELTAMLKSMRERRGGRPGAGAPSGQRPGGPEGRRPGGPQKSGGKRPGGTDDGAAPGGERPKRPSSE